MIEYPRIGAVLDQTVGGDSQRIGEPACLAGGDRDVRSIRPAGAQRAHPLDVLVARRDEDELRVRLDDDIGPTGTQGEKACRLVIVILQLDRLQARSNILFAPLN